MTANPSVLDFGILVLDRPERLPLTLTNHHREVVRILEARPGNSLENELWMDGVPAGIASGGRVEVDVVFTPKTSGARDDVILFDLPDPVEDLRVRVTALVVDGNLTAHPSTIDFGRVIFGEVATATVVVRNHGSIETKIEGITPDNQTSAAFSAGPNFIRRLASGEQFTMWIDYRPQSSGIDEGRIVINDDSDRAERLSITVRGQGYFSEIELIPQQIAFNGVPIGEKRTRAVDIRSIASETHRITRVALNYDDPFWIETSTSIITPFDLAPGERRRVEISYQPLSDRAVSNALWVESAALPEPVMVELTGTPQTIPLPKIELDPQTLNFGTVQVGWTVSRSLMVRNEGSANLRFLAPPAFVPEGQGFSTASDLLVLPPDDEQSLSVTWTPEREGWHAVSFEITTNDPRNLTKTAAFYAVGTSSATPGLRMAESTLRFGRVPRAMPSSRTLRLENDGSATLRITNIDLVEDADARFRIEPVNLPIQLDPFEHRDIPVSFSDPLGLSAVHSGTIVIESNDPDTPNIQTFLAAETVPVIPNVDLSISLSWSGDCDLDLHLVRPLGNLFDRPSDCCYCNGNPNWGDPNDESDDPWLDVDDIDGGTETIRAHTLAPGIYQVSVHFEADRRSAPEALTAEVTITRSGAPIATLQRALSEGQRWVVGSVSWDPPNQPVVNASTLPLDEPAIPYCF